MDAPIEHIVQALREQFEPLDAEAVRLKAALSDVKDKRDRIEAALAALGGGSPKAKPQRAAKSGPTKRQVTHVAEELVRDNGPLSPDDLGDLVKERLAADGGGSLRGFSLRFREALAAPSLRRTAEGLVTLADGRPAAKS